jgi:hypothetical protein
MVTEITTSDAWEASWMLLNGCEILEIESTKTNGRIICHMVIRGENITRLQLSYLNGEAKAPVLQMRSMVGQVNAWMYAAKKKFKGQQDQPAKGGES